MVPEDMLSRSLVTPSRISSTSCLPFSGTLSTVYPHSDIRLRRSDMLSTESRPAALPMTPELGRDCHRSMATLLSDAGMYLNLAQL